MSDFVLHGKFPHAGLGGPGDLARRLGKRLDALERLAANVDRHYRPFTKPKPDGGVRRIDRPEGELKRVQEMLNSRILAPRLASAVAYGGVPGRAHTEVYSKHVGQEVVCTIDIEDFFPSITNKHVFRLARAMGMNPRTASLLTRLVTFQHRLPQGSPASTTIANLLLHEVDRRTHERAHSCGVTVTRAVDDIHISGPRAGVAEVRDELIRDIHRLGLRLHRGKLKTAHNATPQVVMNAHVNTKPSLPRSRKRGEHGGLRLDELRANVRSAEQTGLTPSQFRSLKGKLLYAQQFNVQRTARLLERLAAIPMRNGGYAEHGEHRARQ